MARTIRLFSVLLLIIFSSTAYGQAGAITGRVLDDKKQPVIGAVVEVTEGNIKKGGAVTDYDGNYVIKPIDGGRYDVKISYTGYSAKLIQGVLVSAGHETDVNAELAEDVKKLNEVTVVAYKAPLINVNNPNATNIKTAEQIEKMPTRDTRDIAASAPGVYQSSRGADLNISGARSNANVYIIDGVVVQGTQGINLSQGDVDQVEVMTSGISAKYGDASGGIINITTKGPASKLSGDVLAQHSIDGYNNNFVSFNLSGPLFKKAQKDGSKKPVLGFTVGGDFYYDNNRSPSYLPTYVAKPGVESNLQKNPLHIITDGSTGLPIYKYSTEYITMDSLNAVKSPSNHKTIEGRAHAKLDYQLAENINLQAGGNFDYVAADQFSTTYAMFASSAIPTLYTLTGRGYLRFTQRFGKPTGENANSIISNAYYQVQADYQVENRHQEDPNFKTNIFDYAYIGKFNQQYSKIYLQGNTDSFSTARIAQFADSAHGFKYGQVRTIVGTTLFTNYNPSGVTYERSELNPVLANYTTQYYNSLSPNLLAGGQSLPYDIATMQAAGALANGDLPNYTYQTYANVGEAQTYYYRVNNQQYSLSVNASFDLQLGKTKHAIEFGLYYQQRKSSIFEAISNLNGQGTRSIWDLMRQLTNSHITIDKSNPIFVKNGQQYTFDQVFGQGKYNPSPSDTILYNYYANTIANNQAAGKGDSGTQSTFDRNLRLKLGLNPDGTDWINVDNYGPNTYSLSMFKADELLNSGNSYVYYYGFNYDGSAQTGNVNFNDFWTAKDKNGNYTRPLAPFQPNYTAGYILDNFRFKDIHFNVGVRIERYDANTSVLKDPYTFYPAYSVGEQPGSLNLVNNGVHPSNIGSDYTIYVNDNTSSSPAIVGYRSGDNWYDPTGKLIEDPNVLKNYSGGRDPQPYLKFPNEKINDASFTPGESFVKYTPQVNILPRISFSFPITDVALFYAHYDIYAQRPDDGYSFATPKDYFFLQSNSNTVVDNPNLKPAKTFDYEVGFQQKLTERSAITISGFYKERKDMIEFRPYLFAWPTTYYTYGNRDFSSTKGLTLKYDLRRMNHFTANISYTLQFAEGTGSTPTSTNGGNGNQVSPYGLLQNFIEAGLPNLRYVTALSYDSRHIISANFDYRFAEGEGPLVNGKHVFQNMGLNVVTTARSGEPYTRYVESDEITHTVIGGVNGSRLPWHYNVDLKLDKDFALDFNKKHADAQTGIKPKRPLYLNVFVIAQNVFNIKDILHVYGYTGRPDDNGYLTSPQGIANIANQTFAPSYTNMYSISHNPGSNYNAPRVVSIGAQLNF